MGRPIVTPYMPGVTGKPHSAGSTPSFLPRQGPRYPSVRDAAERNADAAHRRRIEQEMTDIREAVEAIRDMLAAQGE